MSPMDFAMLPKNRAFWSWLNFMMLIIIPCQQNIQMSSKQSSARQLLQKICQQLDQQIQNLLNSLNLQNGGQLSSKLVQRCLASTKNAIMRALAVRWPQIVAIQERCKMLVIEVSEQLQAEKDKNKGLSGKYHELVLECDRYKMETVQTHQLYQNLLIQHQNITKSLKQQKKEAQNRSVQTEHDGSKWLAHQQWNQLQQQRQQREQQRQLYHQELAKNNAVMQEMRKNQLVANQRIQHLLQQAEGKSKQIEGHQMMEEMMKKQLGDLVMEVEELKYKMEEDSKKWQQEKEKTKNHYENLLNLSKGAYNSLSNNLSQIKSAMKQVQLQYSELFSQYTDLHGNSKNNQDTIVKLQQQIKQQLGRIGELEGKTDKIGEIASNQEKLEKKYTKKIEILEKYGKDMHEKNKFYKHQNERLYQAMEQYAGKQLKLNNTIKTLQSKIKHYKDKEHGMIQLKRKMKDFCDRIRKEIAFVKKSVHAQYDKSMKNELAKFRDFFQVFKADYQIKLSSKLQQIQRQRASQREDWIRQTKGWEQQFHSLQQKSLQSQINSNRVANALVDSKNQVYSKITQQEKIIRALEEQLRKEQHVNQESTRKLAEVVRKYQRFNLAELHTNVIGQDHELQKQIIQQRNRLIGLQNQYQSFMQK